MKIKRILFEGIEYLNYIIDEIRSDWDEYENTDKKNHQRRQELLKKISQSASTVGEIALIKFSTNLTKEEKRVIASIIKFELNTYLLMLYDKNDINKQTIALLESSFYKLLEHCRQHYIQIITYKDYKAIKWDEEKPERILTMRKQLEQNLK